MHLACTGVTRSNAVASIRQLDSGLWRARVYDQRSHKQISATFTRRRAAESWARDTERALRDGVWGEVPRRLYADWEREWFAARVAEPKTLVTDRGRLDNHVLPAFRDLALDEVTPLVVQTWIKALQGKRLAAATVRSCHNLLSASLGAAVAEGLIRENPAKGARRPTVPPGREVYLTREQVDAIAKHLRSDKYQGLRSPAFPALTIVLAFTGLRFGEAAGLHMPRVDLLRKRLRVAEVMQEIGSQRTIKAYPKGRRNRTVPIPDQAARAVEELMLADPPQPGGLLFRGRTGRLIASTSYRTAFQKACAAVGVPACRPHDLRHTYASWLIQDGVSLVEVARLMGHSSTAVTERYAHLVPDQFDAPLRVLNQPPAVQPRV